MVDEATGYIYIPPKSSGARNYSSSQMNEIYAGQGNKFNGALL